MPTGRLTYAGGISSPAIQVPNLPGSPAGVIGSSITYDDKHKVRNAMPQPSIHPGYGASAADTAFNARMVPEIAKANYLAPSNQGRRLRGIYDQALQAPPSGSQAPARSQMAEGYTDAIQVFASSNTWQLSGPSDSPGSRAKQPSLKFVSPFESNPIPTKMPWDI